jgi:hypothetical protein
LNNKITDQEFKMLLNDEIIKILIMPSSYGMGLKTFKERFDVEKMKGNKNESDM